MKDTVTRAAEAIQAAKHLYITAGAGMGVDSGLPDFRGDEGFWRAYPALRGYPFQQMANPRWFVEDPTRAWGFYYHRLNLYRATIPHTGFEVLRKWANDKDHFILHPTLMVPFKNPDLKVTRSMNVTGRYDMYNMLIQVWGKRFGLPRMLSSISI